MGGGKFKSLARKLLGRSKAKATKANAEPTQPSDSAQIDSSDSEPELQSDSEPELQSDNESIHHDQSDEESDEDPVVPQQSTKTVYHDDSQEEISSIQPYSPQNYNQDPWYNAPPSNYNDGMSVYPPSKSYASTSDQNYAQQFVDQFFKVPGDGASFVPHQIESPASASDQNYAQQFVDELFDLKLYPYPSTD